MYIYVCICIYMYVYVCICMYKDLSKLKSNSIFNEEYWNKSCPESEILRKFMRFYFLVDDLARFIYLPG